MSGKTKISRDYIWVTPNGKPPVTLTPKQKAVFDLVREGYTYAQIAYEIGTSEPNVVQHMKAVRTKFGAKTNANAVYLWNKVIC